MYSTCNTTITIVYMDTVTKGYMCIVHVQSTRNTTITIIVYMDTLTKGYMCIIHVQYM